MENLPPRVTATLDALALLRLFIDPEARDAVKAIAEELGIVATDAKTAYAALAERQKEINDAAATLKDEQTQLGRAIAEHRANEARHQADIDAFNDRRRNEEAKFTADRAAFAAAQDRLTNDTAALQQRIREAEMRDNQAADRTAQLDRREKQTTQREQNAARRTAELDARQQDLDLRAQKLREALA